MFILKQNKKNVCEKTGFGKLFNLKAIYENNFKYVTTYGSENSNK